MTYTTTPKSASRITEPTRPRVRRGAIGKNGAGRPRNTRRSRRGIVLAYLVIAPTLLVMLVFLVYPFVQGLIQSLFRYNGGNVNVFIGLDNFFSLADDAIFRQSVLNGLLVTAFTVTVTTCVPLLVAWLVHHFYSPRLKYAYRFLVMVPVVVPGAVVILISGRILKGDGVLNTVLRQMGLGQFAQNWLTDGSIVLLGIMLVGFPYLIGVYCLLYLGALGAIPRELYEAAQLDGAGRSGVFKHVELPAVAGQIRIIVTLGIVQGLQAYDTIYILTKGGPNDASVVPGIVLFKQGFSYGQFGMANAVGVSIMLITLAILGIGLLATKIGTRRG